MSTKIQSYIKDRLVFPVRVRFRKQYEKFYFKSLRKRLTATDFSIFSPNCYAGIAYHRLGCEFLSPTINTQFPIKKQYLKFISNLEYYLNQELQFIEDPTFTAPVAMLDDVKIVFVHYRTQEEAEKSWNRRKIRVNYDKLFFVFDDILDIEYSDIVEFNKLQCAGKVVFTAKEYNEIPCAVQIKKYKRLGKLKAYLVDVNCWTGKHAADRYFDVVEWLNIGCENK